MTLGLMTADSKPPDGARVVHDGTVEMLLKQDCILDEEAIPFQQRTQHTRTRGSFLPYLIDESRPGHTCIKGHPQITGKIDP